MSNYNKHNDQKYKYYTDVQSGTLRVIEVTPELPPTSVITGIKLKRVFGTGKVVDTRVSGPIQIGTTNSYIYKIEVDVRFKYEFKNIPAVVANINSSSGAIFAPNVGVVTSLITVIDNTTTCGFTYRVQLTIQDFTGAPPAGVNALFHQLLQPTGQRPLGFNYHAK